MSRRFPYAYPLAQSTFAADEIAAAKAVLDSGRMTMGKQTRRFEAEFARWTGASHAIMVNSGSSANLLMTEALLRRSTTNAKLRAGDEVLVPALAWPTTVWPLLQLGLVPVLVDIDPHSMAIDLQSAQSAMTSRTRAMFLIHVLGQMPVMKPYLDYCARNRLVLIEDVCESLGAHDRGLHAGTLGLMASFSCYFSHHISTIEGGLIITSDEALSDDLKSMRAHGWIRERSDRRQWIARYPDLDPRFLFAMPGYNVRPTELQAAIGLVQLKKLDSMLDSRECLARQADEWVRSYTPWLRLIGTERLHPAFPSVHKRRQRAHSWMTLPFVLNPDAPISRATLMRLFEEEGIETRPIIAGNLARHPACRRWRIRRAVSLKKCDYTLRNGFMIGCHPVGVRASLRILERAFRKASQRAAR